MRHRIAARAGRALVAFALVAVLLAALTGAATARTTDYAKTIRDGRAAAKVLLEQSGAASLSLALVSGDRVVWQEGFGYADKATSTPPAADTMYGLGSVSKVLATIATMKLADQGRLDLDAPLSLYVPSFTTLSPAYRQITVRMLLDHSSGLPGADYASLFTGAYFPGYLQQVMATAARHGLKTTPGYMSVYCNDGFTLLEALIGAVTGTPYAQYVQDEVFAPLEMAHSGFPLRPFPAGTYAKAYRGDVAQPLEVANALASGGAYSTPTDMSHVATMLMAGGVYDGVRILSADAVTEMGTDQTLGSFNPAPSDFARYGLGWDTVSEPGLKAVGVTGWCKGGDNVDNHAALMVAPKARLAMILTGVAPLDSGRLETLGQHVLLHALVEQGTLRRLPTPLPAKAPPAKRASAAQLAAMEGFWAKHDMVVKIDAAADTPQSFTVSRLTDEGWQPFATGLRLRTDGRFHANGQASSLRTLSAGGRRYLVNRFVGGNGHYLDDLLFAQKLRAQESISAAWQARVGRRWLAVTGQPDAYEFSYDGGTLLSIDEIPGLTGFVTVSATESTYGRQTVDPSGSDALGAMFLQIPGEGSRDLEDAVVETHGSEEWIGWGSTLYRPQDSVPALAAGANAVTFGAEGYAEWRSLPTAAAVQISAGAAWRLYDATLAVLGSGTAFPATAQAPSPGCYLLLFGPARASTTVTVEPLATAGSTTGTGGRAAPHQALGPQPGLVVRLQ
jgi:CubicO group peptidase (beta-lactamase class C family)